MECVQNVKRRLQSIRWKPTTLHRGVLAVKRLRKIARCYAKIAIVARRESDLAIVSNVHAENLIAKGIRVLDDTDFEMGGKEDTVGDSGFSCPVVGPTIAVGVDETIEEAVIDASAGKGLSFLLSRQHLRR